MRAAATICILIALSFGHVLSLRKAGEGQRTLPLRAESAFVLPAPLLKIAALEFDGIASDILFLKTLVFRGGTYERTERPVVKAWEWKWMFNMMDTATDIDRYFIDPYYFAAAHFVWDGHLVRETNVLLSKGIAARSWDWMLPFFVGFNNFYFLHDNATASEYLMRSWRIPGAPDMFASLASKLAYKGNDTENAIVFLEELLKRTEDKEVRKHYAKRLRYMQGQLILERAVARYQKRHGRTPQSLDDLVGPGGLQTIPREPYGGQYYLAGDGTIRSTSEMQQVLPSTK